MKQRANALNLPANDSQTDVETMRLQVFLAHSGVASRRASEEIIAAGRVSVNGVVVTTTGEKVKATDVVCVDGKQITLEETKRYVLLYKPAGYVCTMSDEKGRQTAAELLKPHFSERLYNVGRLDMFSQGLVIYTNDGEFARHVSHPSSQIEKEYIVETSTPMPRDLAQKFMKGLRIEGVFYKAKVAEELNPRRMRVVLIEGKNREIRRVFTEFEMGIRSLKRVRIGTIQMGDMKPGEFRELTASEVQSLIEVEY